MFFKFLFADLGRVGKKERLMYWLITQKPTAASSQAGSWRLEKKLSLCLPCVGDRQEFSHLGCHHSITGSISSRKQGAGVEHRYSLLWIMGMTTGIWIDKPNVYSYDYCPLIHFTYFGRHWYGNIYNGLPQTTSLSKHLQWLGLRQAIARSWNSAQVPQVDDKNKATWAMTHIPRLHISSVLESKAELRTHMLWYGMQAFQAASSTSGQMVTLILFCLFNLHM